MGRKGGEIVPFRQRRRGLVFFRSLFLVVFLVLLFLTLIIHIPVFTLQEIEIVGNKRLSDEDVIRLTALETGANLFSFRLWQLQEWLLASPWVKEVSIKRTLPDGLTIVLQERSPSFLVPYYTSFYLVADDGTILTPAPADLGSIDLPVLTGLEIKDPVSPGQSLSCPELNYLVRVLEAFPDDILEVMVEAHLSDDGGLVFYTREGTQILFGQAVDIPQKVALIQKTRQEVDAPIATINVRSGERVHVSLKQSNIEMDGAASPGAE